MGFILVNLFFGIIIVLGFLVLWVVWPPDSPWSPWWRTSSKKAAAAGRLANITSKDFVYELGSGDANFLVAVCKKFGSQGYGIEIDFIRHWVAHINAFKNGVSKRITLKRGNFYDYKFNKASVVFVYLVPRVLEKVKPKLIRELAPGTRVVSNIYKFQPDKELKFVRSDSKNNLHLYKIT